jgi:hypothetical protein
VRHKLVDFIEDSNKSTDILQINDQKEARRTFDMSMSGVIGTSSTAELRSSMNVLISVYVFE